MSLLLTLGIQHNVVVGWFVMQLKYFFFQADNLQDHCSERLQAVSHQIVDLVLFPSLKVLVEIIQLLFVHVSCIFCVVYFCVISFVLYLRVVFSCYISVLYFCVVFFRVEFTCYIFVLYFLCYISVCEIFVLYFCVIFFCVIFPRVGFLCYIFPVIFLCYIFSVVFSVCYSIK